MLPKDRLDHGPCGQVVALRPRADRIFLDHHGMVTFSQRVNVPVGPSGPRSATRTTSREPSSTDSVPWNRLRLVLVKAGETMLTLSLIHISEPTRLGMISYAV